MTLADVNKLSLSVNMPDVDGFLPEAEAGARQVRGLLGRFAQGEQTTGELVTYEIDDPDRDRASPPRCWLSPPSRSLMLQDELGHLAIKSLEITGGCAAKTIDRPGHFVDDVTLNDTVIDFN